MHQYLVLLSILRLYNDIIETRLLYLPHKVKTQYLQI